jgi:hypothetical protein
MGDVTTSLMGEEADATVTATPEDLFFRIDLGLLISSDPEGVVTPAV